MKWGFPRPGFFFFFFLLLVQPPDGNKRPGNWPIKIVVLEPFGTPGSAPKGTPVFCKSPCPAPHSHERPAGTWNAGALGFFVGFFFPPGKPNIPPVKRTPTTGPPKIRSQRENVDVKNINPNFRFFFFTRVFLGEPAKTTGPSPLGSPPGLFFFFVFFGKNRFCSGKGPPPNKNCGPGEDPPIFLP